MLSGGLRRVTIVTHELRGFQPVGGMGTATTFLALALARMGHSVEILLGVMHDPESIDPEWRALYDSHGIRIRPVPPNDQAVAPAHFERTYGVGRALQADPPDVVVVHDLAAPAYVALRLRQLTEVLQDTLFVVFCHGTRRWVLELSRRLDVADLEHVLALNVLERMSLELADVVVSPSAYLVDWMRGHGWRLPERTLVIPYLTRSAALGEPPPAPADGIGRLRRIAFFGRLEEKKGLMLFAAALNRLQPELLDGIELEFVGRPTATWRPERVEQLLSQETKTALGGISFVGDLDQAEALARLKRAGTLAVAPSLGDNSPNTVYECIEHGIPLIASNDGGIPELVAEEDRARVLFEPTPAGIAEALRRALAEGELLRPARPAFSGDASYRAWAELVELRPERSGATASGGPVDVVVVQRGSHEALERSLAALEQQTSPGVRVHVAESREDGLAKGEAPYVVFLDEGDVPEPELIEVLLRAQARSGADAVSCGLRSAEGLQFFSGQPGGLGVLANDYGAVALLRRDALPEHVPAWPADRDPDWRLLAGLTATGAKVVSIPEPLVTRSAGVGTVREDPGDALLAVHELERALPRPLRGMARLAAGLAANAARSDGARKEDAPIARLLLRLRAAVGRLSGPRR
jgi:glycosyltransferase involved in cell wall biosynthesis